MNLNERDLLINLSQKTTRDITNMLRIPMRIVEIANDAIIKISDNSYVVLKIRQGTTSQIEALYSSYLIDISLKSFDCIDVFTEINDTVNTLASLNNAGRKICIIPSDEQMLAICNFINLTR